TVPSVMNDGRPGRSGAGAVETRSQPSRASAAAAAIGVTRHALTGSPGGGRGSDLNTGLVRRPRHAEPSFDSRAARPRRDGLSGRAVEDGGKFTRDYLMELLWPDVPAARARHSLAQALTVVKAKVGPEHLIVQRTSIALVPGVVDADVRRLDSCEVEIHGPFL